MPPAPPPRLRRTILTHFSQRYPRVPAGIEPEVLPLAARAVTAFDGMLVPLAALPHLPHIMPPLALALAAAEAAEAEGEVALPPREFAEAGAGVA